MKTFELLEQLTANGQALTMMQRRMLVFDGHRFRKLSGVIKIINPETKRPHWALIMEGHDADNRTIVDVVQRAPTSATGSDGESAVANSRARVSAAIHVEPQDHSDDAEGAIPTITKGEAR